MESQAKSVSLEDTKDIAKNVLSLARDMDKDKAVLITLSGELGAGKTAFTKLLAELLGIDKSVTSPTFVLRQDYLTKDDMFKRLIHIDAYRFEEKGEANSVGLSDVLEGKENIVVVEWPERIKPEIKEGDIKVDIVFDNNDRIFNINKL